MKQNYSFLVPMLVFATAALHESPQLPNVGSVSGVLSKSIAFCHGNVGKLTLARRFSFQSFMKCYGHVIRIIERYLH